MPSFVLLNQNTTFLSNIRCYWKTCEQDFQKIKNARQYYINFTDYLTTSYLNITNNKTYKTLSAVP